MSENKYLQFRETYLQGLARIRAAEKDIHPRRRSEGDSAHIAAAAALDELKRSQFGKAMIFDESFRRVHAALETSLVDGYTSALSAEQDGTEDGGDLDVWVNASFMQVYREYLYWGRLGAILHHYRDMGQGLGTNDERAARASIQSLAQELDRQLTDLADAPIPQALYRTDVLHRVEHLKKLLQRVHRDFNRSPLRGGDGPSALHQDEKLLRRQFGHVCCLLAIELFGQINPGTLGQLLELKSSTADDLGLEAWPGAISAESASREQRRSIEKALKTALSMSKRRRWVTRPIIQLAGNHTLMSGELTLRRRS